MANRKDNSSGGRATATSATASSWRPASEVELIVGTPPGGGQDRPARALMRVLDSAGLIDVPMRLTNISGKGGGNAWDALRRRAGDMHVLSVSSSPLLTNKLLGVSDFDHADLTPIATLYTEYLAFIVRKDSPLDSGAELLDRLRSDVGALTYSLATAIGTTNHLALGQIAQHVGSDPKALKLRVFESALHAVADVVEGRSHVGAVSAASAVKALEAGDVRTLAVSAPSRLAGVFEAAPTWTELSVPCTMGLWRGIIGPAGIGREQVAYWEQALAAATSSPMWAADLKQHCWSATCKASEETRRFLDAEREFLGRMVIELGLVKQGK